MIQQSLLRQARSSAWKRWLAAPLFGAGFALAAFTIQRYPPPPPVRVLSVVIDAGHGGKDNGTTAGGLHEKDISLAIAQQVARQSVGYPIRILLSRNADSTMSVADRLRFCKANHADLCVSLHVDFDPVDAGRTGIESYVAQNPNRYYDSSVVLGSLLQAHLGTVYTSAPNLFHRLAGHVGVLDRNSCPSVLVEVGYLSNRQDKAFITQKANQERVAREVLNSLTDYAGGATPKSLPVQPAH
jgi:N-acetylmuramoyl-L-alanine amidase